MSGIITPKTNTSPFQVNRKEFKYRIVDFGTRAVLGDLNPDAILNEFGYSWRSNDGKSSLRMKYDEPYDNFNQIIAEQNLVEVYEFDKDNPVGQLQYYGYIPRILPKLKPEQTFVEFEIFDILSLTKRVPIKTGGTFVKTWTNVDPADVLRDIIDIFDADLDYLDLLYYTADSIQNTGETMTLTMTGKNCFDGIQEVIKSIANSNFYFRCNNGLIELKEKSIVADHLFTIGFDVDDVDGTRSIIDYVKDVHLVYNGGSVDSTGSNLYGSGTLYIDEQSITNSNQAQAIADRLREERNRLVEGAEGIQLNSLADLENIKPSDTFTLIGQQLGSDIFTEILKIDTINYKPYSATLQVGFDEISIDRAIADFVKAQDKKFL